MPRRSLRSRPLLVALALTLGIALPAHGAEPNAPRAASASLLLRDTRALTRWVAIESPALAAARADVAAARADLGQARALPNPVLDLSASNLAIGDTNPSGLGLDRTLIFGAGISQTFELGKRGPRAEAAGLRVDASRRRADAALGDRVALARWALARVVYLSERQVTLEDSLRDSDTIAEQARRRADRAQQAGVEYDRLALDAAKLGAEVAKNQAELAAALAECEANLAAPCRADGATLADVVAAAAVPAAPRDVDAALGRRGDLAALRLEGEAARRDARLARRRAVPDVTVRLGYTHDRFTVSGDQGNTLSLAVALPLPVFDRGQHDAARALARADAADAERRAGAIEARGEVSGLYLRRAALRRSIDRIQKELLPRSKRVVDTYQRGVEQGQLAMTELLLARRDHIGMQLGLVDLQFELFTVSNDLRRALGLDQAVPTGGAQ